jgi:hypothetical protein
MDAVAEVPELAEDVLWLPQMVGDLFTYEPFDNWCIHWTRPRYGIAAAANECATNASEITESTPLASGVVEPSCPSRPRP